MPYKNNGGIQALFFFGAIILIYLSFFGFNLQEASQFTFSGLRDIYQDIFN